MPRHHEGHPQIRMVESHSLSPTKMRTGIGLSLKADVSSHKETERSHIDVHSCKNSQQTQCGPHSRTRMLSMQRQRPANKDMPQIVESKITYARPPSPRQLNAKHSIVSSRELEELPQVECHLNRQITGTTMHDSGAKNTKETAV